MSSRMRWLTSEKIAIAFLEELGYKVLETRKKININDVEIGEVDAIVVDENNNKYAVEIKAGKIDVAGIRQTYVNAVLLNAKPMVVCKGFADDAAKELASKLNIHVVQLSDVFLVEAEELSIVVREVIEETLTDYLEFFYSYNPSIKNDYIEILNAICLSPSINEAAEKLGLDVSSFSKKLEELRRTGVIPRWARKYVSIKRVAQILIQKQNIVSALEESRKLIELIKDMLDHIKELQIAINSITQQLQKLQANISKLDLKFQEQIKSIDEK